MTVPATPCATQPPQVLTGHHGHRILKAVDPRFWPRLSLVSLWECGTARHHAALKSPHVTTPAATQAGGASR
jgi:hypothetical protein